MISDSHLESSTRSDYTILSESPSARKRTTINAIRIRSESIDISSDIKSLVSSTCDQPITIKYNHSTSQSRVDQDFQSRLPKIHQVRNDDSASNVPQQYRPKVLSYSLSRRSLHDQPNIAVIDTKVRPARTISNCHCSPRDNMFTTKSSQMKFEQNQQVIKPLVHKVTQVASNSTDTRQVPSEHPKNSNVFVSEIQQDAETCISRNSQQSLAIIETHTAFPTNVTDFAEHSVVDAENTTPQFIEISSESSTIKNDLFQHSLLASTDFQRGRCGLRNLGNTCFMNSALQCLSNVPDLTKYILQHGLTDSLNLNNCLGTQGKVATAYEELIRKIWSGTAEFISPSVLKRHVSELFPRFAGFGQQDSHEFLNVLLDALHEDLKRDPPDLSDSANSEETSLVSDIFHGQIRSRVICDECKEPLYTYDSISFLALPISNAGHEGNRRNHSGKMMKLSVSLDNCFGELLKPEMLGENGQWFCEKCNRLTDAEKKLDLWTLPRVLIIQLKRFTYDLSNNSKIETFVDYPLQSLDLSSFVKNPTYDQNTRYDLIAVSAHTGSLVGGHYTTYAKNFLKPQWYHFNDTTVHDVKDTEALTGNAYILVYCKR